MAYYKCGSIYTTQNSNVVVDTASGSVANFETDLALPLKSLEVDVNAVQSGTGDPSPDNVRPITGFSQANVFRTGVNLWDEEWEVGSIDNNTGLNSNDNNNIRGKNYIAVKPNTTYYCYSGSNKNIRYFFYTADKTFISSNFVKNGTFTTSETTAYIRIRTTNVYGNTYNNDISINYPSTDTEYHAYNGNTYLLPFGDTYYGGHFTQDKAGHRQFEVTHGYVEFDGSNDENWERHSSGSASNFAMKISLAHAFVTTNENISSNYLTPISSSATWGNYDNWITSSSRGVLNTGIQSITDVAMWRTYLASNPLEVRYELATPYIIDLPDGEPITTLLSTNNIYADTGDISLQFRKIQSAS